MTGDSVAVVLLLEVLVSHHDWPSQRLMYRLVGLQAVVHSPDAVLGPDVQLTSHERV